jgi:hypothetical protein
MAFPNLIIGSFGKKLLKIPSNLISETDANVPSDYATLESLSSGMEI